LIHIKLNDNLNNNVSGSKYTKVVPNYNECSEIFLFCDKNVLLKQNQTKNELIRGSNYFALRFRNL